jgi:hypothetical protein
MKEAETIISFSGRASMEGKGLQNGTHEMRQWKLDGVDSKNGRKVQLTIPVEKLKIGDIFNRRA